MNPYSGEVVALKDAFSKAPNGFHRLPKRLQPAAAKALGGEPRAVVSLTDGSALANWAAKKRKAKSRKKMAKASKLRNRQP